MITKIILLCLISIKIVIAQVPGKISGHVEDDSGSPLIGVNILLQDYSIGASTDIDGNFIILNISPGKYTIVVSSMGYQTIKESNVTIKPGLTTTLDFVLHENSVELGEEVIVTAKSKLIQKDETGKTITISSDELEKLPTVNLQEVLSTQSNINVLTNSPNAKAGYNEQGIDDIRMRGGRNNEVALLIDGVKVSNPVYGGFGTQISVNAIKQIDIESGGYSAKYGNALSGVINLTTKDGVEKTNGSIRYYSSNPFDVDFLTNGKGQELRLQNFQATLQGRVPFLNEVSFFISGEVNTNSGTPLLFDDIVWDEHRTIQIDANGDGILEPFTLPSSQEIIDGYLRYENLDSIQLGLASNWKKVLGPDGRKINPVDMYKGWKGLGWDNSYNFFGKINFNLTTDIRVLFSYLLDKRYRQFNNFNAYYDYNMQGQNIQLLSSNKESLTINHTLSGLTFYSLRLSRFFEKRDIRILKDYSNKYASSFNIFSPPEDNLKTPEEYIPYASSSAVYDPFETSFYLLADNRWYSGDFSTNYEARFDFTSQLNQQYLLETGFQLNLLDIDYHAYQNISSVDPYPTIYNYSPIEAATFIQLKAEYESIIFNIGGRLDYLNSNSYAWEDPFDPLGEQNIGSDSIIFNPLYKVEPKLRFSPRLGIAYPLTDASVISFNFGHFFQTPNYRDMYQASGENRETSVIRGNIIGNANLLPEKSIQYEISLQQQFTDDLAVRFNLFTKETVNQVGSVVVPAYSDPGKDNPFTYSTFINNNLGSARGFEVNLTKRLSNNFAFYFNYTFSVAKVLQPTSWDGYWSGDTNNDIPRKETTAPWDQTHVIRTNFQYSFPNSQNSENLISHLLSNMNMTIFYYGESGMPYTPTVSSGKVIEPYSEQWPFSHRIDLQISKMWDFLGLRLIGLLQIKNLFDTQNVLSGYTLTGSATDPGTSTYYTLSSSYWDSRNNNNFKISRTIYLGIELQFGGRGY